MLKPIRWATPLLMACPFFSNAQYVQGKNEVGINIGALVYQGDLSPNAAGSVKTAKPMLGLYYSRILSPYFSVRGDLNIGSLRGDDSRFSTPSYMQQRNLNFRTRMTEVSAVGVLNFFGNNNNKEYIKFSPYIFAGVGYSFLHVKRDWSKTNFSYFHTDTKFMQGIAVDTLAIMPKGTPIIPIGIGLKYAILPNLSLVTEATYRRTFTDYLDGFSQVANPAKRDGYYSVSIGAVFNFGRNKMACPKP